MGILHNLLGHGDVLLKGEVAAVDHYGGEAAVNAALAGLEVGAMVQVHGDGQIGVGHSRLDHLHQVHMLGVLAGAGRHLQNDRGVFHLRAFGDALDNLHVIHVESADGIAALVSLFEHFLGCNNRHGKIPPLRIRLIIAHSGKDEKRG